MSLTRRMQVVQVEERMDSLLKVAFASTDMEQVNQHFGSAKSFAIYGINCDQAVFIEAAQFGEPEQDGNEEKLEIKMELLKGCAAVYCQAVGASAVKKLVALGIQPVKVQEGSSIQSLLTDLQKELRSGPSSWLARAIKQQSAGDSKRFDEMADEQWSE